MDRSLTFGTVQGRLIQAPPGQLQWFPQDFWESEFFLAKAVGVDYVELIAEIEHNPKNPIWDDAGCARVIELCDRNGLLRHAFCNDFIIPHALSGSADVLEQNFRLIERGKRLGMQKLILPLFEKTELTLESLSALSDPLRRIADKAVEANIVVCLETILTAKELIEVLDKLAHPNLAVVYDTGNRVAFGHDLPGDIRLLGSRIRHVHIKDKNSANQNVLLGTGLVNFKDVFVALRDIGYEGPYTFETNRGADPLRTMRHNIDLVRFFDFEGSQPRA